MKNVRAWLRMFATSGTYPIPTSEQSYRDNTTLIDGVIPLGGTLQADGSWLRYVNEFTEVLPGLAGGADQQYTAALNPGHGDTANIYAVLDDADAQNIAASEMVKNATTNWDAIWDGAVYDTVGLKVSGYPEKQSNLINMLFQAAQGAGILFEFSMKGIYDVGQEGLPPLANIQAGIDSVLCYCYGHNESPYSIAPYWWVVRCIEYMLQFFPERKVVLGVPLFSCYWPVTGDSIYYSITHQQAMDLIHRNNSFVQWVERHETGLIREKYADVGRGHLWINDGDTLQHRLSLVDQYDLAGVMLFTPGMGDKSVWQVIAKWKQPNLRQRRKTYVGNGAGGYSLLGRQPVS